MSWQDTNQQAIEKYLEDLLRDDLGFEEEATDSLEQAFAPKADLPSFSLNSQEESVQEQQLKSALLGAAVPQPAPIAQVDLQEPELGFKEPELTKDILLPKINLTPAKPSAETLADVLEEIEGKQTKASPVAAVEVKPAPKLEPQPEVAPAVKVAPKVVEQAAVVAKVEATGLSEEQPPALPPSWKNGRPAWAQERFECLLFKVKGLTLAVPLVELGGIIKIEDAPTPLFGQPGWFLGLLRNNNINVAMVDTAQWVLPPAIIAKNPEPYELIIRIHQSHWGLACNAVDKSITLEPDQVRWRSSLTKRPWLAGTVIDHMCALIDVAAFDRLLQEGHGELEPANLSQLKEGLAED